MKLKTLTIILLSAIMSGNLFAQVELPPIFSDNMVLQQKSNAPIWGKTQPNKQVEITTSWNKKKYNALSDSEGKWKVAVATPKAGGPYTITISDGTPLVLKDVLIGEVWVCSGQSNMEMPVKGWGKVDNFEQELIEADKYLNIRLLHIEKATSTVPLDEVKAVADGWQVCNAKTVEEFSSVAYFFGRDLLLSQKVPIGLINTSWGGTIAEAWTSGESLETMPDFREAVETVRQMPQSPEGMREYYKQQMKEWEQKVKKMDKGIHSDGRPGWATNGKFIELSLETKEVNNSDDWTKVQVPNFIETQGFKNIDGIFWFRKTIEIPAAWEGKELTLNIPAIDDNDWTYFNETEIGSTEGWNINRNYTIPKELVKKGRATIAIRVLDTGGDGGIHGDADKIYIELSPSERISLAGEWTCHLSVDMKDLPPIPRNPSNNPNVSTFLYNAMLHPIIPYTIKGAIWYQGESNESRAYQYRDLFPLMITDWRKQWGYDFPFYFVQLANFRATQEQPVESMWAELQEAQLKTLNLYNTGMAVTTDIGDAFDIHPKNKQDVGKRLALAARAKTYGEKIAYSGPIYDSYQIEGNKIRISFKNTDKGLIAKDGSALKGFAIAGVDHTFHWADAVIDRNTVVVSCPLVEFPIAVRYAWADNPVCNLYNGAGLPASPFRTDDWAGLTFGKK